MGKHFPIRPPKKPDPGHGGDNPPPAPGVPLLWWTENAAGRVTPDADGKTDAEKANVGIATLIIQRDDGSLWRVGEDKPPYTWTQVNPPGGAATPGDPYKTVQWRDVPETGIEAWTRVIVTNEGAKTFNIAPMEQEASFEIVDVERIFDAAPVTLIPPQYVNFPIINIAEANLVLDTVGQGSTWRFLLVGGDLVVENVP